MMVPSAAWLLLMVGCGSASASPRYPLPAKLPPHPRLILTSNALDHLKHAIATDAVATQAFEQALATAERALEPSLPPYPNCSAVGLCRGPAGAGGTGTVDSGGRYIDSGGKSGSCSRPWWCWWCCQDGADSSSLSSVADAVTLALVHRLLANGTHPSSKPSAWSRAAVRALEHWAGYPSWYWPVGQALELSGATLNFALCYDWLHDVLTPEEKKMVQGAIVSKGLEVARSNYRMELWWTRDIYNWNLVSNGGMVAASLAVDGEHALAQEVFEGALGAMQHALVSWQPSGVWPEGSGYWSYALQVRDS